MMRNNPNFFNKNEYEKEMYKKYNIKKDSNKKSVFDYFNNNINNNNDNNNNNNSIKMGMGSYYDNKKKLKYDNSYLFKNNYNDNNNNNNNIRQEVLDILNNNTNNSTNNNNNNDNNIDNYPKKRNKFSKKKKKFTKRKAKKQIENNFIKNISSSESQSEDEALKKKQKEKEEEEKEKNRNFNYNEMLRNFFNKIEELKKSNEQNSAEIELEIEKLIDKHVENSDFGKIKIIENRLNNFKMNLESNRKIHKNYYNILSKGLMFKSPFKFVKKKEDAYQKEKIFKDEEINLYTIE